MSFEQKNLSTDTSQKHSHSTHSQLPTTTESIALNPLNYSSNPTTMTVANPSMIQPLIIDNLHYNRSSIAAYPSISSSANNIAPVSGQLNFLSSNKNTINNFDSSQLAQKNTSTFSVENDYNSAYSQSFPKHPYSASIYDNSLPTSNIPFYNPGNSDNTSKTSFSVFRPLYGDNKNRFVNEKKKRPRRKHDEIERLYICNYKDCKKGYGTLNHLNAHVLTQNHGQKRKPEEFKELRQQLRERRRKRQQEAKPNLLQNFNNFNSMNTSYLSNTNLAGNSQSITNISRYDMSLNHGLNSGVLIQKVSPPPSQQQYLFNDRQLQISPQPYLIYNNPPPQQFAYQQQKPERDNTQGISGHTSFDIPQYFSNLQNSSSISSVASAHAQHSLSLPHIYSNAVSYSVANPVLPYEGISSSGNSAAANVSPYGVISSSVPSTTVSTKFPNSSIFGSFDSSSTPTTSTSNCFSSESSSKAVDKNSNEEI